ncbi:MAG: 1-acyl-sn-glycerol-3-phosphate acyltransferase [candidate division Zixibacteria bacterium]|nr:1-acyl-sn-glycerol-3-phosphate acyltransferase [candidate division Zixibacteria bacterium]
MRRIDVGHILRAVLWRVSHFFIAWPLAKILFDFETRGLEHLPLRGGVLAAANHASYLDPPLLGNATPRVMYYMARADLFAGKFSGAFIRAWGAFPIRRDVWSAGGLKEALRKLDEGKLVMYFPEGTRTYDGNLRRPMVGAGLLAYLARAPVVPVYTDGTFEVLPRRAKGPRLAKITVSFGPPVDLKRHRAMPPSKETYVAVADEIMAGIAALREKSLGEKEGPVERQV